MNNLERTLFTFNLEQVNNVCFQHVFWTKGDLTSSRITSEQKVQIEACVEKYLEAFNIVKLALREKKDQ